MAGKRKRKGPAQPEEELWEVDYIVARKLVKGEPKFLIRWKGYDEKSDTWEGLDNLAGPASSMMMTKSGRSATASRRQCLLQRTPNEG